MSNDPDDRYHLEQIIIRESLIARIAQLTRERDDSDKVAARLRERVRELEIGLNNVLASSDEELKKLYGHLLKARV